MAGSEKLSESTIQTAVWQIELGPWKTAVYWVLMVLVASCLGLLYMGIEFRGFNKREAMDQAQLARNIARGEGFTTKVIRPLSMWQLKTHGKDRDPRVMQHPDLANPPLYPAVVSVLFRFLPANVFEMKSEERGNYTPELVMVTFNMICLMLSVGLVYVWARHLFDDRVALTAALLLLFADVLWQFCISGLPTSLLLLLFLLALYGIFRADQHLNPPTDESAAARPPLTGRTQALLLGSAVLLGLCFLTRYRTAVFLLPVLLYVWYVTRRRSPALWVGLYLLAFLAVITPWLVRNYAVSGSLLGIAQYEFAHNTGPLNGDVLPRSYHLEKGDDLREATTLLKLATRALSGLRQHVFASLPTLGTWLLVSFFTVGLMYRFRRSDVTDLRYVVVGGLVVAAGGMSFIGMAGEQRSEGGVYGENVLILLLPLVVVYAVAFFYLLLERIPFRIRLTRGLAIALFALLNVMPLLFTLLPPRKGVYEYPPYFPPVIRAVAAWFDKDDIGCSDLPWAVAWYGDRRCVWLPVTVGDFYEMHDFVVPKEQQGFSFLLLTSYMLDRPLTSQIFKGEYGGWSDIIKGRLPKTFPLKAVTTLPPGTDQFIFADRARWKEQAAAAPLPDVTPPKPDSTDKPAEQPAEQSPEKPVEQK